MSNHQKIGREREVPPRRIILVCEHEVWLRPPLPNLSDGLWCVRCQSPQLVGPAAAGLQKMYLDEWISLPVMKKRTKWYTGTCVRCDHVEEHKNWYSLRANMEEHYVTKHVTGVLADALRSMKEIEIPSVKDLTEPPF